MHTDFIDVDPHELPLQGVKRGNVSESAEVASKRAKNESTNTPAAEPALTMLPLTAISQTPLLAKIHLSNTKKPLLVFVCVYKRETVLAQ